RAPDTRRSSPPRPLRSRCGDDVGADHARPCRTLRGGGTGPPRRSGRSTTMRAQVTRRAMMLGSAGAAGATALAACSAAEQGEERPVRIKASDTTLFQPNFNPYSGQALQGASGLIYEPLQVL